MDISKLSNKHYSALITPDIIEICKPLEELGICYFSHARFFNNNSSYTLTNNWESYYYHCQQQMPITTPIPHSIRNNNRFYFLPFLNNFNYIYAQPGIYRDLFKVGQPIYFIERYPHYFDFYGYGARNDNADIVNFYLNNIDLLEKFKFYFKEKADKIIKRANTNRITVPEIMVANFKILDIKTITNKKQKYINDIATRRYVITVNDHQIKLSEKEVAIIRLMADGNTLKEIANLLYISPRTSEAYYNNIKIKLRIATKAGVIKLLTENGLLQ